MVPVPASGGRRRPCARRLPIRSSLFSYSTVAGARALVDSQDALSVFEATVVEDRVCNWVGRRVGGLDLRTNILVITCPFLPLVSLFLFFEVPDTCPFLFPRIIFFLFSEHSPS